MTNILASIRSYADRFHPHSVNSVSLSVLASSWVSLATEDLVPNVAGLRSPKALVRGRRLRSTLQLENARLNWVAASFTVDTSLPRLPFITIHRAGTGRGTDRLVRMMRGMSGAAPARNQEGGNWLLFGPVFRRSAFVAAQHGSQARIHIVDPRPHILSLGPPFANGFPASGSASFLSKLQA